MKKIMILGASILQLPAIKEAKKLGLSVVVVDMNPEAIGFKEENIEKEIISTIEKEKVLEAAKKHHIDGIMTLASDMPMQTVAYVASKLNLVGIDEETALKATNKYAMREALKKNNISIPEYHIVKNLNECLQVAKNLLNNKKEIIIKPVDNSGSRGIVKISKFLDKDIEDAYCYSSSCSRNGDVLVEEFMEGDEVSVEAISINGQCQIIQITDKLTTGAPYFVEMGHSQPSMFDDKLQERIKQITKEAVKAIGILNGPSHTEVKITKDGPKIVELGARLGGDNITTHLVPLSTGVNMVNLCIRIALGEVVSIEQKFNRASAIRYFESEKGLIDNIEGVEEAEKIKGVKQISFVHNIGENINEIKNSADRIGFVISSTDTPEEAINICNQVKDKIIIKTTKY